MLKSYHAIYQWNTWLGQKLGAEILKAEHKVLSQYMQPYCSKHAVLIGVPKQYSLLDNSPILDRLLLSPLAQHQHSMRYIETSWDNLPISSGSVDLVLLPHSLEFVDHPRHILAEACRIVKPEGKLIIFGFNPHSLWGLRKSIPNNGHLLSPSAIKQWLSLTDFELINQKTFWYRSRFKFLEWISDKFHLPLGSIYMLIATAKVIPLTPIRLHWKQQSEGIKLTIPGPSVRNSS